MQSVMLRSSILDEAKLSFENNLKYCPDHNLFMEIASRYVVGVLPEFIVKYRVLDNSLSKRTVDIASAEIKFTLDKISSHNPKIKKKFTKEFIQAYNKLNYYNAVAFIYRNDRKGARKEIASIASSKVEYCIFYFLLFLPVSNETILKILGR